MKNANADVSKLRDWEARGSRDSKDGSPDGLVDCAGVVDVTESILQRCRR